MRKRRDRALWWGVAGAIGLVVAGNLLGWKFGDTRGPVRPQDAAAADPTPADAKAADPYRVPEGGPEELLRFIDHLPPNAVSGNGNEAAKETERRWAEAVAAATAKVLAAKPTRQQADRAAERRIMALSCLAESKGQDDSEVWRVPEEVSQAGFPDLSRTWREDLLAAEIDYLNRSTGSDPEKLLSRMVAYLQAGTPGEREARLAMSAGEAAEGHLKPKAAAENYRRLAGLLAGSSEPKVAKAAARMEGIARRLTLTGQPLQVTGKTLAGETFDSAKYRGKVILVIFWATYCGPCREEIDRLREHYKTYHDRGFEVVPINVDPEREPVEMFVKDREIPWPVLFDADAGKDNLSDYYGIVYIPQTILVDRDGKVLATDLRDRALARKLERLLPAAEAAK